MLVVNQKREEIVSLIKVNFYFVLERHSMMIRKANESENSVSNSLELNKRATW